ncbi:hypothetical protein ACX93W_14020 [Paenibacillus sp. CAU 1782]
MNSAAREEIIAILGRVKGVHYYSGNIPKRVERNARDAFRIPPEDELFAVVDLAIIRKGRSALLFTDKGIYFKYVGSFTILTWARLSTIQNIRATGRSTLMLDDHLEIDISQPPPTYEEMARILRDLRDVAHKYQLPGTMHKLDGEGYAVEEVYNQYTGLSIDESIKKVVLEFGGYACLPPFDAKKASHIAKRFLIPATESVLAFLDFGQNGSGKEGFLLTSKGFYWKTSIRSLCYVWEDLYAAPDLILPNKSNLEIDGQSLTNLSVSSGLTNIGIKEILQRIISLRPKNQEFQRPVLPAEGWPMLMKEEEKQRVFDKHVIHSIVKKRTTTELSFRFDPADRSLTEINEEWIATSNSTLASYTKGVTVSNQGIYINTISTAGRAASFIPYTRLAHASLFLEGDRKLFVNSWYVMEDRDSPDLYNLLLDLKAYALSLLADDAPEMYEKEAMYMDVWPIPYTGSSKAKRWVVAEDKVIRGVWDEFELRHGLDNGIINPDCLDVWSEGMESWIPMTECSLMKKE